MSVWVAPDPQGQAGTWPSISWLWVSFWKRQEEEVLKKILYSELRILAHLKIM